MSRKTPVQSLPHYGVRNNLTREDHIIRQEGKSDILELARTTKKTFMPKGVDAMPAGSPSISRAKHFMRTGRFE